MRVIPDTQAQALRSHLQTRLDGPVTVELFTQPTSSIIVPGRTPCELCDETEALFEDVAALSELVTLVVHDVTREGDLAREHRVTHLPTAILRGAARGTVRFVGIPAGLEFGTLLEDLVHVSRGTTSLSAASLASLGTISRPVHIQVFVTPSCPYCPRVASLAHQVAVEHPYVTADVVEVTEFPDLAARYRIQGVPTVVLNDAAELLGLQTEPAFIEAVVDASSRGSPAPVPL